MAKVAIFVPGIGGSNLYSKRFLGFRTYITLKFMLAENPENVNEEIKNIQSEYVTDLIQDSDIRLFGQNFVPGYTKTRRFFYNNVWSIRTPDTGWLASSQDSRERIYYEFPYDWRQDIRKHAVDLNKFVADRVLTEFPDSELYLFAHSTGGIISRAYLSNNYLEEYDRNGNLLRTLQPHPLIKKQILIGTPNHGASKAYRVLKTGQGFIGNRWPASLHPRNVKDLSTNWPLVYQLLPTVQYEKYFSEYGPIASIGPALGLQTVKETYIASENIRFSDPEIIARYSLNNDTLVNKALQLHDDLARDTFLPVGDTYAIYSDNLETVAGVRWNVTNNNYHINFKPMGDGTVPARSVYDLKGLSDDGGEPTQEYNGDHSDGNDFDPDKHHAIKMRDIEHTALPTDINVLGMILKILEWT